MNKYIEYFGFNCEPFINDIAPSKLLKLPDMVAVKERMDYVFSLGGIMAVTGDVGSGKSTSLRWALSHLHPSEALILNVIANTGSILEFYKQINAASGFDLKSASRSRLQNKFKTNLEEIVSAKKQKPILVIDEASLLRIDVFSEIHTLTQFHNDSKNMFAMVFCGQAGLLDKLSSRAAAPLASRVMARAHLKAIDRDRMEEYLHHHLRIAGVKKMLFAEQAVTAIQQGSGGLLRKANHLAKGGLIAAAIDGSDSVSAEHIRLASTEII